MAGSVAGLTAVICTYTIHMARIYRTLQVKEEHTYTEVSHVFKAVCAKEKFEKCLTRNVTIKYVYGHHGIQRDHGFSLNYTHCVPQAVAFTIHELMKQFFHLN
ncbi:hypothetical protein Celaphus_00017366 [Cervus elaphus hippelaphus]|uniref:Uncharacterized protein n=1 Tax=Cervus elaphus hippelaphus TaxID=46360 RepID=A0A212D6C5_CEREH|nr:hypothetical protein Celaphus_00017366 [Cervus elaphus hippelaphus]